MKTKYGLLRDLAKTGGFNPLFSGVGLHGIGSVRSRVIL